MQLENILKSDVFFFVATIAVAVVAFVSVIVGIYLIKILRDIRVVIKDVKFKYRVIQKFINHLIK